MFYCVLILSKLTDAELSSVIISPHFKVTRRGVFNGGQVLLDILIDPSGPLPIVLPVKLYCGYTSEKLLSLGLPG